MTAHFQVSARFSRTPAAPTTLQVNGFRGDTSIQGRIEHDIYYIENWTLLFDIKILFMTVFKFSNDETLGK